MALSAAAPLAPPSSWLSPASAPPTVAARCKLTDIAEHRVYSAGIRCLEQALAVDRPSSLFEFPLRADGSSKVMCKSFFERLLKNTLEVKSCMESDISAAQMDLRYLSTEQLLKIRASTLDFQTGSGSHSAHNNFLDTVDAHLAEKLAQQLLQSSQNLQVGPGPLRALGRRVSLTLGAADCLANGWGVSIDGSWKPDSPLMPSAWVLEFDGVGWPSDSLAALLHIDRLRVELIPRAPAAAAATVASVHGYVAVVCDGSSTAGSIRTLGRAHMMRWEIAILDPRSEEMTLALAVLEAGPSETKQNMVQELAEAFGLRGGGAVNAFSVNALPRPLRGGGKPSATIHGGGMRHKAEMQLQENGSDDILLPSATASAAAKRDRLTEEVATAFAEEDEEEYSVCDISAILVDRRDADSDGSGVGEADAANLNTEEAHRFEYNDEARDAAAPLAPALVDASPTLTNSSLDTTGEVRHLQEPGVASALAPPVVGGRCPRPSVAFLSGRVAGAIACMEGSRAATKREEARAASPSRHDAPSGICVGIDAPVTGKDANASSVPLTCGRSCTPLEGSAVGKGDAPISTSAQSAPVSSQRSVFSSRVAAAPKRAGRCPRQSVAFLSGKVASVVSRLEETVPE